MRGIERGLPGMRWVWAFIAAAGLGAASCKTLNQMVSPEPAASGPEVLEGGEIPLVNTRFEGAPRELYTGGERFLLSFSFDPSLIDLARLKGCGLWAQDRSGGPWRRIGSYPAKREPTTTQFVPPADGAYGLRTSAIYDDGTELLVPGPKDRPLVWLYVDRTPPKLTWISPAMRTPVAPGDWLDLVWGASEMRFGDVPAVLEWSADGGASWSVIDRVKSKRGTGNLSWKVPPAPSTRTAARPLLRITAWDLVGNRSSTILPLTGGGPSQGAPPEKEGAASLAGAPAPAAMASRDRASTAGGSPESEGTPLKASHKEREGTRSGDAALLSRSEPPPAPRELEGEARQVLEGAEGPGGSPSKVVLKNFNDGSVHPGGAARYIFFWTDGLDRERTRIAIEWRAGPDDPWKSIAPGVPAREGKFLWKLPLVTTGEGSLRLTAIDPAQGAAGAPRAAAACEAPLSIDSQPPVAGIRGIQRGPQGEPLVALDVYDQGPAGLKEVKLFTTSDGGATWRELEVADPSRPTVVPDPGPRLGFWVSASDRAGNSTARPEAGSLPQETFEAQGKMALSVEDFQEEIVRGGEQLYCLWRFSGPPDQKALVEISQDGGGSWSPVGEAPAQSGKALWVVPGENCTAIVRVRVRLPDGSAIEGRARPVRIDAVPPQLEPGQIPGRVASELKFPLAVTDPGGSGVQGVTAYVRPGAAGQADGTGGEAAPWTSRPQNRVSFDQDAGQISISVADLKEGTHDLFLGAKDRAGNGGLAPAPSSSPIARFVIDRTPVAIRAAPTALPWVEGLTAAVQVEMDLSDAVEPLWLEERSGQGWKEILRWESLAPGEDLYRFPVPVGRDSYEVRFGIRDAVGNVSYAVVGPRPVERSIRLVSFVAGESLKAGANREIAWTIHAALNEVAGDLKVAVSHQPKEGAEWIQLYDDLRASSACVFTVPAADGEDHRLRVSLYYRGELLGEDVTGPLKVAGAPAAPPRIDPQVVPIDEESLYYSERGDIQWEKYKSTRAGYQKWFAEITAGLKRDAQGSVPAQELEKLSPDIRRSAAERERQLVEAAQKIRENYQKALERDPRNYRAAYGMAQLIHKTAPERSDEAIRYLERTVEIKADHSAALNDLGASLIIRGDYEAAEEPLRRALAVADLGSYHFNLALCLYHQRKTAEARSHFEKALEKGGSSVKSGEVYYYIVCAYLDEGQSEEARRRFGIYRDQIPASLRESLAAALKGR